MRKIGFFLSFALLWSIVSAQSGASPTNWHFGLRAGTFASTFNSDYEPGPEPNTSIRYSGNEAAWRPGIQVQAWASRRLSAHLALQTAIQLPFSSDQVKFSLEKDMIEEDGRFIAFREEADFRLMRLDVRIPLLLRFELGQKTRYFIGAGGFAGTTLTAWQNGAYEQSIQELDPNDPQVDTAWQVFSFEEDYMKARNVSGIHLGLQAQGGVKIPAGDAFVEVMLEGSLAMYSVAFPTLRPVNIGLNIGYQFAGK